MSDIYFIRVEGADRELMESMVEQAPDALDEGDNIVIVPEEVEPLDKDEARQYLEEMADALDMTVIDG